MKNLSVEWKQVSWQGDIQHKRELVQNAKPRQFKNYTLAKLYS